MADRERMIAEISAAQSGGYTQEARSYYDGVADGLVMSADYLDAIAADT